jgi:subtilisin
MYGRAATVMVVLGAAVVAVQGVSAVANAAPAPVSATRYVVVLKDGTSVAQDTAADDVTPSAVYPALEAYSVSLTAAQVTKVQSDPNAAIVAPDRHFSLIGDSSTRRPGGKGAVGNNQQPAGAPITSYSQFIPTALERVGLQNSKLADVNGHGPNVAASIAVIDSGISPSPDLRVVGGVDCSDDATPDLSDGADHGTEVASVAAAIDNKFGVVGTAPGAPLYDVKVFDTAGNADTTSLLCGIDWVVAHHKLIQVVNMSFEDEGDYTPDHNCGLTTHDPFHMAVCRVHADGITLVTGSGNDAGSTEGLVPQAYPEVITVGGYQDTDGVPGGKGGPCGDGFGDLDDMWAAWSNSGPSVDLMAVADCNQVIADDDTMEWDSGTSFASPAVAGAAADVLARFPHLPPDAVEAYLKLTATHRDLGSNPHGYGLLNMAAL